MPRHIQRHILGPAYRELLIETELAGGPSTQNGGRIGELSFDLVFVSDHDADNNDNNDDNQGNEGNDDTNQLRHQGIANRYGPFPDIDSSTRTTTIYTPCTPHHLHHPTPRRVPFSLPYFVNSSIASSSTGYLYIAYPRIAMSTGSDNLPRASWAAGHERMVAIQSELAKFVPADFGSLPIMAEDDATQKFVARLAVLLKEQQKLSLPRSALVESFKRFDPGLNTLVYLGMLDDVLQKIEQRKRSYDLDIATWLTAFLTRFDPVQVRYMGAAFQRVMEKTVRGGLIPPKETIELAVRAILRLDPDNTVLTSAHCDVVALAYQVGHNDAVMPILEVPVVMTPTRKVPEPSRPLCDPLLVSSRFFILADGLSRRLSPKMVADYYMTASSIFCAERDWASAERYTLRCVCYLSRSSSLSEYRINAYSRWIICSLLSSEQRQQAPQLPAYISRAIEMSMSDLCAPYLKMAKLFNDIGSAALLKATVDENAQVWRTDRNSTLVTYVVKAYQRHHIRRLSRFYRSLPMSMVCTKTQCAITGTNKTEAEVLHIVADMIKNGEIDATVAETNGTTFLRFTRPDDASHEAALLDTILEREKLIRRTRGIVDSLETGLQAHPSTAQADVTDSMHLKIVGGNSYQDSDVNDEDLMD